MTISRTIELPLPAAQVQAMCLKAPVLQHVLWPWFGMRGDVPAKLEEGQVVEARLYLLTRIPAWRHRIRLVRVGEGEIYTNERGGPVTRWNHRLTFEATSATTCRYTDAIDADPLGALFARVVFRWRHRRWAALARLLA